MVKDWKLESIVRQSFFLLTSEKRRANSWEMEHIWSKAQGQYLKMPLMKGFTIFSEAMIYSTNAFWKPNTCKTYLGTGGEKKHYRKI